MEEPFCHHGYTHKVVQDDDVTKGDGELEERAEIVFNKLNKSVDVKINTV